MSKLTAFGWSDFFEKAFVEYRDQGFENGRVTIENRDCFSVFTEAGEITAEVAGRLLFTRRSAADLPKVGDWVALQTFAGEERAIIHTVLPRKTKFSRKAAGKKTDEQVIATNIDVVFVVQSLDGNFNVRRLERTLVMVNESGAMPVVILNKADLCDSVSEPVGQVREVAPDVKVLLVSAKTRAGLDKLKRAIKKGQTFAFIGSSGVGKSTLINCIVGDAVQKTREVRSGDSKGRHTTTRRELILLKKGACLIDTPGMRELQLWQADEGITDTFADIEELAGQCHFSDCKHIKEQKCAVLAAVESEQLAQKRYENYMKMQEELALLGEQRKKQPPWVLRKKERSQSKMYKQMQAFKRRNKGK